MIPSVATADHPAEISMGGYCDATQQQQLYQEALSSFDEELQLDEEEGRLLLLDHKCSNIVTSARPRTCSDSITIHPPVGGTSAEEDEQDINIPLMFTQQHKQIGDVDDGSGSAVRSSSLSRRARKGGSSSCSNWQKNSVTSSSSSNNNIAMVAPLRSVSTTTSSSSTISISSSFRAPQHRSTMSSSSTTTSTVPNNNIEYYNNDILREVDGSGSGGGTTGLTVSLDAGMAAVRRWIRSRSTTSTHATEAQHINNHNDAVLQQQEQEGLPWGIPSSPSDDFCFPEISQGISGEGNLLSFSDTTRQSNDVVASFSDGTAVDDYTRSVTADRISSSSSNGTRIVMTPPPPTIREEQTGIDRLGMQDTHYQTVVRQRALSEPDAAIRDYLFQRALSPHRGFRRRRYMGGSTTPVQHRRWSSRGQHRDTTRETNNASGPIPTDLAARGPTGSGTGGTPRSSSQLSSSAEEVLYASSPDQESLEMSTISPSVHDDQQQGNVQQSTGSSADNNSVVDSDPDPQREARARWICINRRFQVVITIVALIFSLLLFAILVCWVVLTSAYVVSIDKSCDVPLKAYFWLATLQLILDVFRSDIMRCIFRWDANSNQRIPCRVITYNLAYLTYAGLVLRLGIGSVFVRSDATCRATAPELFRSSTAFVSLSIAAWSTIILGYLLPFCFVATLLTLNGYTPSSDSQRGGAIGPVFPTPMGAPPGCVDQLRTIRLENMDSDSPRECCICMENFTSTDAIVETDCKHLYHRNCLADWLRQARTCPVCRMDVVPNSNRREGNDESNEQSSVDEQNQSTPHASNQQQNRIGLVPATRTFGRNTDIHHEVVSLFQIIRRSEMRNRQNSSGSTELRNRSGSVEIRNRSRSQSFSQHDMGVVDEGHNVRQY